MSRSSSTAGGVGHAASSIDVHRCRFLKWRPNAVSSLAWTQDGSHLAVGRETGDIEIWKDFVCETIIPGVGDNTAYRVLWLPRRDSSSPSSSTEGSSATLPRLFSAGLTGRLIEWDLRTLKPKRGLPSTGGPVWSMESNPQRNIVALGCEDGSVRLFRRNSEDDNSPLEYHRALGHQKGRVLSLCWGTRKDDEAEDGKLVSVIAMGTDRGRISIWDTESRGLVRDMRADRFGKDPTWIWALKFVQRGRFLAVGDSIGKVTLWDTAFGTQTAVFSDHIGDVLALAVEESTEVFYSASADGSIAQFRMVETRQSRSSSRNNTPQLAPVGGGPLWVRTHTRKAHSHDVKALVVSPRISPFGSVEKGDKARQRKRKKKRATMPGGGKGGGDDARDITGAREYLIAGGADTCLSVVQSERFGACQMPRRILPVPSRSALSLATRDEPDEAGGSVARPLMLYFQGKDIELWKLGASDGLIEEAQSKHRSKRSRKDNSKQRKGLQGPIKFERLRLGSQAEKQFEFRTGGGRLTEAKISPDGEFVAFSDTSRGRLYRLKEQLAPKQRLGEEVKKLVYVCEKQAVRLQGAPNPGESKAGPSVLPPFSRCAFLPPRNSKAKKPQANTAQGKGYLVLATLNEPGGIVLFDLDTCSEISKVVGKNVVGSVRLLEASRSGKWLAFVDTVNVVHLFNLKDPKKPKYHGRLPGFDNRVVTAIGFHPTYADLAVALSDNNFQMFSKKSLALTDWSRDYSPPQSFREYQDKATQIVFDTLNNHHDSIVFLVCQSAMWVVDLDKTMYDTRHSASPRKEALHLKDKGSSSSKKRKSAGRKNGTEDLSKPRSCFMMTNRYQPIQFVGSVPDAKTNVESKERQQRQLIVVETPWLDVVESLPLPVYRHKYGT